MATGAEAHRLEVLVVDDDADTLDATQLLLQMPGVNVKTTCSGTAAIEQVKIACPDVLLLDIGMPQVSGYDVAEALHHIDCANEPVLVALTGYSDASAVQHCAELGFDLHFTKPIDYDVIRELLWTLSEAHTLRQRHRHAGKRFETARAGLLTARLQMTGTLLDVAATTRNPETTKRCLAKAHRAIRALSKDLRQDDAPELRAQLVELERRLDQLRSRESEARRGAIDDGSQGI